MTLFTGSPELREWLKGQGFSAYQNTLADRDNACNWYDCRRIAAPALKCSGQG